MRKIYLYLFFLIASLFTLTLQAQNCWTPLGPGVGANQNADQIYALASYNGNLIAGGKFDSVGGIMANSIASWNGTAWSVLGSGVSINMSHSTNVYIESMATYNGELYVAGQFDTAGGVPVNNIAKWNGISWSAVGSGLPGTSFTVNTLAVYNGAIYAAGYFDTAGGLPAHSLAKWDGIQWSAIDSGRGINGTAYCLFANTRALYVGGSFNEAGNIPVKNIAAWNDTTWSALGTGPGALSGEVTSMASSQGNLYAALLGFSNPNYTDSLAMWNGTTWSTVGGVETTNFNIGIDNLFAFDNNLIVGGGFDSIGGVAANNLAQWNGTSWSEFGGGANNAINAFESYDSYLYIGGIFNRAGSDSANIIAKYSCATDGIRGIPANHAHIYPNPTTGLMNLTIDNVQDGMSIQIYDLLAEKIFQSSINASASTIDLSGYAPGTYIYHISGCSGENISAGTVVIQ